MAERIDLVKQELFIDSPSDLLLFKLADNILNTPQFKKIFGESVYPYRRMDLQVRELPALRMYINNYVKEFDSWFVEGDVVIDLIMPPSIRRDDLSLLPNVVSNALLQHFRRPTKFFNALLDQIPGLNELGKRFSVQQDLAYDFEEEEAPLTQITVNFRIDLRIWDDHLEATDRTKEDPFDKTLGNLQKVISTLNGLKDGSDDTQVQIKTEQKID